MPTWPATLPAPSASGFKFGKQDNRIQSNNEIGDVKTRRRYTGVLKDFDWPLVLTESQKDALIAFFDDDLADGVLDFTVDDPESGDPSVQCRILNTVEPEFLGPGSWRVNLRIRRLA